MLADESWQRQWCWCERVSGMTDLLKSLFNCQSHEESQGDQSKNDQKTKRKLSQETNKKKRSCKSFADPRRLVDWRHGQLWCKMNVAISKTCMAPSNDTSPISRDSYVRRPMPHSKLDGASLLCEQTIPFDEMDGTGESNHL